jgi:hypothetical protein
MIDHDPPHGLGGRGKEMASTAPILGFLAIRNPKVSLMDERCRLKSLIRLLTCKPRSGKLAQFIINQGQKLLGRPRVSLADRCKNSRHVIHGDTTGDDNDAIKANG